MGKNKVLTEVGIVCALAGVLLILLLRGSGRSLLGLSRLSRAPSVETRAPATRRAQSVSGVSAASSPEPRTTKPAAPMDGSAAWDERTLTQINYTAFQARDPFVSLLPTRTVPAPQPVGGGSNPGMGKRPLPASPTQAPPALRVQGILWGGITPKAIINERLYRVNETVEGATIMSIDARGVTIEHQGALVSYPVGGSPSQSTKPSIEIPLRGISSPVK